MTPDLNAIFALRLSTGRKLMLIAMIHRARGGWYRGQVMKLANDAAVHRITAANQIWEFEEMGLIHPHPENKSRLQTRSWRVDPKFVIGTEHETTPVDHRSSIPALNRHG